MVPYGGGTPRSRQIFRAMLLVISEWRGTAELRPASRLT